MPYGASIVFFSGAQRRPCLYCWSGFPARVRIHVQSMSHHTPLPCKLFGRLDRLAADQSLVARMGKPCLLDEDHINLTLLLLTSFMNIRMNRGQYKFAFVPFTPLNIFFSPLVLASTKLFENRHENGFKFYLYHAQWQRQVGVILHKRHFIISIPLALDKQCVLFSDVS